MTIGEDHHRVAHPLVPAQRRVRVDDRGHCAASIEAAEHKVGDAHRVLGRLRRADRGHERLVRVHGERAQELQMPMLDGYVLRLEHHAARHIELVGILNESDEVTQIGERAVPAFAAAGRERGTVGRRERRQPLPDRDVAHGIAGVPCPRGRRQRDLGGDPVGVEENSLASDALPRLLQQRECMRVLELHAELAHDRAPRRVDACDVGTAENVHWRARNA
jgi:hypothetical protein